MHLPVWVRTAPNSANREGSPGTCQGLAWRGRWKMRTVKLLKGRYLLRAISPHM
jgi:hypothetical protein